MLKRFKSIFALIMILLIMLNLFCSCWDNRELNNIFVITGIALDATKDKEKDLNITVQIGVENNEKNTSDKTGDVQSDVLILETKSNTITGALDEFNRDSNHKLIVQHNQIRLFGDELAKGGLRRHIDLQMRDQQARLEVPLLIVEGDAGEALKAKLEQDSRSGIFLNGFLEDLAKMSKVYKVRLVDFAGRILEDFSSPAVPTIIVEKKDKKESIKLTGFALFKDDKMVGHINNEQSLGYVFAKGNVKRLNIELKNDQGKAVLHISNLKTKQKHEIDSNNDLNSNFKINATLSITEIDGFKDMNFKDLVPLLKDLAEKEIENKIYEVYEIAQSLGSDILNISGYLHQKSPKKWKEAKSDWENIYKNSKIDVKANVTIQGTGQIVQSLDMEEKEVEH